MQLESVSGLGEVITLEVQITELVQVADVHLFATDSVVEIEQVHRAAHSVLAILIRDDRAILQQVLHQTSHRSHESET